MMCVKAWVVDMVSVDNMSVDAVSVWGPVLLVHRAGRFCLISLSIVARRVQVGPVEVDVVGQDGVHL